MAEQRQINLLDGSWYLSYPYDDYAWMREHAPAYWDAENELWGISRYDDIVAIEKNKQVFISSSQTGGYRPKMPADPSIIGLDDPEHNRRRNLVSRRFTPKSVLRWEEHIQQTVTELVDAALAQGRIELIEDLAGPLPSKMIGLLLGYPDEMWPKLMEWSARTIAMGGGPMYATEEGLTAVFEFAGACTELYEDKKGCPADDVMSVWIAAEEAGVGDHRFGIDEIVSDCLLLLDGGAETTRTVIARSILQFIAQPDQWQMLRDGADMETAIEEMIRYVTPVHNMCRTAVEDVTIGGKTIRSGDQVVLMYPSANRDPEHFDDPETFDITRTPNHHIAFGFGTHFCLGASLARLELKTMFTELAARVQGFAIPEGGEVDELGNPFVFGINRADVELISA